MNVADNYFSGQRKSYLIFSQKMTTLLLEFIRSITIELKQPENAIHLSKKTLAVSVK